MGLSFNLLNFLVHQKIFTANNIHQKAVLEIGVLKNSMSNNQKEYLSKKYNLPRILLDRTAHEIYEFFGFTKITSLDNSPFEKANLIKNLNIPPSNTDNDLKNSFDLIIDGGSSEHIYNPLIAFSNYLNYLKIGGVLAQFLPVNNYIDHGIYQFSPTFFWSIQTQHADYVQLNALNFRMHDERVAKYYYDGNSGFFRSHVDGLWNGSTAMNLFRFTSTDVIALAHWTKKNEINYDHLIFQTNQEIYRNQWRNHNALTFLNLSKTHKVIFRFVFKLERSFISSFIAKLLLKSQRSYD